MVTYTAITEEQTEREFSKLEEENKDIDYNITIILTEMEKKNPRLKLIDVITTKLFDNKQNYNKMRNYFKQLSKINFRSRMKNRNIFKKIKRLRNFFQNLQSGDFTPIRSNVQYVLASQVNTKKSSLIDSRPQQTKAEGKTKRRKRRKGPNKKKLKTKKKINFKKLRKHITQRFKTRSKFKRSKTRSKFKKQKTKNKKQKTKK